MKKIFILVLVLVSLKSLGQVYQVLPQYGYEMKRIDPTLVLKVPSDTANNKTGIARIGTTLYVGNGTYWSVVSGGGASGWGLSGNTITAGQYLGTNNAEDLVLKTDGSEIARFSGDGNYSIAMGDGNDASGFQAIAIGANTTASGSLSTSMGANTTASGNSATSMGIGTSASGAYSTSMGFQTRSKSFSGTVIGSFNDSTNATSPTSYDPLNRAFQIGNGTANTARSNAMTVLFNGNTGIGTTTPDSLLTVNQGIWGKRGVRFSGLPTAVGTKALRIDAAGNLSVADTTSGGGGASGWGLSGNTITAGQYLGTNNAEDLVLKTNGSEIAKFSGDGNYRISMGNVTTASGAISTAMGNVTTASGAISTAMGNVTTANGYASTAMGSQTTANGDASTAMGNVTTANGDYSTAMGNVTTANGDASTAMGNVTTANGDASTAMGSATTANGDYSTAMGNVTTANGYASTAMGSGTTSTSYAGTVIGTHNDSTDAPSSTSYDPLNRAFQIGNGTANTARSNAMTVLFNGNVGIGTTTPTSLFQVGTLNPVVSLKQTTTTQQYDMRIGTGAGLSSQAWNLYNTSASKYLLTGSTDRVIIGNPDDAYAASTLYVKGYGSGGSNIDAQPDSTITDEGNIEIMASDYTLGAGIAMRQWGNVGVAGSVMGYNKKNMGLLDFNNNTNLIRTSTNRALRIGTNNVERMVIDSLGNVGIGTTTPDSLLTVNQGIWGKRGVRFSGLPTAVGTKALRIDGSGNLSMADTTSGGGASGITVGTTTITSGTSGRIGYNNAGVYGEYPITGTGNVALSASPTFTGTLIGNAAQLSTATTALELTSTSYTPATLRITDPDGYMNITNSKIVANANVLKLNANAASISLQTGGIERLTVGSNANGGNVGIGTNTPNYTLDVTGKGRFTDTLFAPKIKGDSLIFVGGTYPSNISYNLGTDQIDFNSNSFFFNANHPGGDFILTTSGGLAQYVNSGAQVSFGSYVPAVGAKVHVEGVLNVTGNTIIGGTVTASNLSGTNTGDQTAITGNAGTATSLQTSRTIGTLTGDVTSAGSGFNGTANNTNATTIATNVVSNTKLAQMAANTFKANNTGSTANAADVTVAQAKTLLAIANTDVSGLGTLATQNGTFSGTSSGTNTGDNAVNSLYSGLVSNATHTGDATGATALTLATVNSNVGTFGSATQVATFTVNGKGLITAASNTAIAIPQSAVTNLTTDLSGKQATLVSGTNIKTVNGNSLVGSGDVTISGSGLTFPQVSSLMIIRY